MAPFRFISKKQIQKEKDEAVKLALKGYYDSNNQDNEYFKRIETLMRGVKLPMTNGITRAQIRNAYETMATVNGVIDYIADNVGEVMKYLELRTTRTTGS